MWSLILKKVSAWATGTDISSLIMNLPAMKQRQLRNKMAEKVQRHDKNDKQCSIFALHGLSIRSKDTVYLRELFINL